MNISINHCVLFVSCDVYSIDRQRACYWTLQSVRATIVFSVNGVLRSVCASVEWYVTVSCMKRQTMYVWRNIETGSFSYCCSWGGKNKCYVFCVRVCSLGYPACNAHTCIMLSSVACPAVQNFSTLSHKRHDFIFLKMLSTKCVFWFSLQLLFETFLVLRITKRDVIKNVYWSSCKVPF